MRDLALVTVARSDFSLYLPLLRAIQKSPELTLKILASGSHLSNDFGRTVDEVKKEGFEVFRCIDSLISGDSPSAIGTSIGVGTSGFSQCFSSYRPDILIVLGDRFDMLPAALAALPFNIPIAHIHGGEVTEGAFDDAIRHSLTKLSHLHFASMEEYARRIIQMGEDPHRVFVTGALGLDAIRFTKESQQLLPIGRLARDLSLDPNKPVAVVTFHPETLAPAETQKHIAALLSALGSLPMQYVFTFPNADTNGRVIISAISEFVSNRPECRLIENLGRVRYFSLLNAAAVMIGNSSSGIIEAASFRLPVVNIGDRQRGRVAPANVISCSHNTDDIASAMRKAVDADFRDSLSELGNPYGDGFAAERIVEKLTTFELNKLVVKKFYNLPTPG